MTGQQDLLVQRDGRVWYRASRIQVGRIAKAGRTYNAYCRVCEAGFTGYVRRDVLAELANHYALSMYEPGDTVTRTTHRGGKHPTVTVWEGTVTALLKTKVRVRWHAKGGARTVATLDHYPNELTKKEQTDA